MILVNEFYNAIRDAGIGFIAGVPDSLLSSFCAYVDDQEQGIDHVIAANEGNAVAMAAGYQLSSGNYSAVYMQNSGLGNAINPLASLTDPDVYSIPMLMVIGWRGEPGTKDEPQHIKQGQITVGQLELMGIPYFVMDETSDPQEIVSQAVESMASSSSPSAILVRKGAFQPYSPKHRDDDTFTMKRERALNELLDCIGSDLVVATTGKTSRELFELRVKRGEAQQDFLTVGAMGHTSSIAMGVSMANPSKRVVCIDGDGSLLMHMGAMPVIASQAPRNLVHVLLNNAAHESVGGQPTVAGEIDFSLISRAVGYTHYVRVTKPEEISQAWTSITQRDGPALLELRICTGSRKDLGRPTSSPLDNKLEFINKCKR